MKLNCFKKVFGPSSFNPMADGEMGPYPLDSSFNPMADGEMGPYPLSDNTNLLSSSNYGMSLYRNYGSSYGTNYASSNLYTAKYSNKKSYASTSSATAAAPSNLNNQYTNNTYQACNRMHCNMATTAAVGSGCASASQTKCNTPVPTRRNTKRERDSFRRHSAHGRMSSSSQGIICNWTHTQHTHTHNHENTQTHTNEHTIESTPIHLPISPKYSPKILTIHIHTTLSHHNCTGRTLNEIVEVYLKNNLPHTCDNSPHSHEHTSKTHKITSSTKSCPNCCLIDFTRSDFAQ